MNTNKGEQRMMDQFVVFTVGDKRFLSVICTQEYPPYVGERIFIKRLID